MSDRSPFTGRTAIDDLAGSYWTPGDGTAERVYEIVAAEVRATTLREAHDAIRSDLNSLGEAPLFSDGMAYQQGMDWAARIVDRMADPQ